MDPYLEAEYNNRAKVPGHGAVMACWRDRSEATRRSHEHAEIDLRYGPDARHAVDVFWPGPARDAPIAVFLHGGYWQALDKSWFSHLAGGFNARGIALAVPSYNLCPQVPLARIVEDARSAIGFLLERYARDVLVCGHSAGGHLTAMMLVTDWAARGARHRPLGGVAVSGLFDLRPLVRTSINAALALDETEACRLSPVALTAPAAPLRAFVGALEGEEYARQSAAIARAWAGRWSVIEGADHFTAIAPLEERGSLLMDSIAEMIEQHGPTARAASRGDPHEDAVHPDQMSTRKEL